VRFGPPIKTAEAEIVSTSWLMGKAFRLCGTPLFLPGALSHRRTGASLRQGEYFAIYLAYPRMRRMFVSVSASCPTPTRSYSNAAPRQSNPISTIADGRGISVI